MSGVFSSAAHAALQYFPSETWQEQFGCAHFLLVVMAASWACRHGAASPDLYIGHFVLVREYGKACRIAGDSREFVRR
jgi:hypothetical protein